MVDLSLSRSLSIAFEKQIARVIEPDSLIRESDWDRFKPASKVQTATSDNDSWIEELHYCLHTMPLIVDLPEAA